MKLSPVSFSITAAAFLGLAAILSGCVSSSDDNKATGGTSSTGEGGTTSTSAGGSTSTTTSAGGTTNTSSSGGSTSTAGTSATNAVACPKPTQEAITDFTYAATKPDGTASSTTDMTFGDFTAVFSGGTFIYPATGTYPLTSDVTQSNWHITGSVGDYSGFGFFFGNCAKLDASSYSGISFVVSGSVATGVATTANTITLSVGTAGNEISAAWLNSHKTAATDADVAPNFGVCTPTQSRYDGSCSAPTKSIPVTATPTTITVKWTDLLGGRPQAGVTPTEITSIAFSVPAPVGVGTASVTPYAVDLIIDDVKFVP